MRARALVAALIALGALGCSGSGQRFQDTTAGRVTCTGVRVGCHYAERFLCGGGGDSGAAVLPSGDVVLPSEGR